MSILDDAIREHLELKRAHGADEAELKRLEDEAFGPPGRPEEPDAFAEAPTEFMATPETAAPVEESGGRRINIADLQEPPPPERAGEREEPRVEATDAIAPEADAPLAPAEDVAQAAPPAEEELLIIDEPSAAEHEIVVEPAEDAAPAAEAGPETGERQAIAEQPTELFDIEAEMGTEDAPVAEPAEEIQASRADAPAAPLADEEDEEDEEFWSEQRLSDELDQALEAPVADEPTLAPLADEHEIPAPVAEPSALVYEDDQDQDDEPEDDEDERGRPDYDPDTGHEDVLEDTPDFLEDAPEDDELWFEQKPPKDFDLD
ncbi:MAG TPA: hypothetical protein VG448_03715 [Solirubrobacterales bacterium]|nr:hypothetical protein [Solirubrobacterales bacterium]